MRSKEWSENKLPLEFAKELLNSLSVEVNKKSLQATNEAFYEFVGEDIDSRAACKMSDARGM